MLQQAATEQMPPAAASSDHGRSMHQHVQSGACQRARQKVVEQNQAMNGMVKCTKWEQALVVLPELQEQRLEPSVVTYNTLISACVQGAQWALALSFLHHLQQQRLANVISFSTALSALDAASLWIEAVALLMSMGGASVEGNSMTYNAAISACSKGILPKPCSFLLTFFLARACSHCKRLHARLKASALSGHAWSVALLLLHELEMENPEVSRSIIPYNTAIRHLVAFARDAIMWPVTLQISCQRWHRAFP